MELQKIFVSGKKEWIKALILYVILIATVYSPVVFLGKSLQPSLYQPHGIVEGWPYGYNGRTPVNTFNIDLATPAYYEWPINKFIGDSYKKGELPLWNPYQAGGTPLAAQYSSRVFFPYQILEDVFPVETWDIFILGRLLVAGFFTFLFLRKLNLDFAASFLGGIFYMFSGAFTWFINLEQFTNNAMVLPVLIYCLERFIQKGSAGNLALSAVSIGLVLLAGQPEMALYILFLGASYYIFRIIQRCNGYNILKYLGKFIIIVIIGFALASPLILPFIEFMKYSHNIHPAGGDMGTRDALTLAKVAVFLTPTVQELPQDPDYYPHPMAAGKTPSGEQFYFRTLPRNGEWDFLGGFTGVLPIFLSIMGVLTLRFNKHSRLAPFLIFFFVFGLGIVLKNFGIIPFIWLGKLPFFDQVWSQRWAGPVWIFSFAVAGAIGFQTIKESFSDRTSLSVGNGKTIDISDLWSRFVKYPLIHALLIVISLPLAYDSYKEWMRHVEGTPISPAIKSAIKDSFPWAVLAFVAIYLLIALWRNRRLSYLSLGQYWIALFFQSVLMITFYTGEKHVLIVQIISVICFIIIIFLFGFFRRFIVIILNQLGNKDDSQLSFSGITAVIFEWLRSRSTPLLAVIVISLIYIPSLFFIFDEYRYAKLSLSMQPYFVPAMIIGTCITIAVIAIGFLLTLRYIKRDSNELLGIIPLGILELWWAIPRGYSSIWLYFKLIPFLIGVLAVWAVAKRMWRLSLAGGILFVLTFAAIDFKSPYGFPDRYNAFTTTPYVEFLKKQNDYYRVMGGYGILFPNYASSAGIYDIRYVNSLVVSNYQEYRSNYLHKYNVSEEAGDSLWFTGRPELLVKTKNKFVYVPFEYDFKTKLIYYSLLGTKYILLPAEKDFNEIFPESNPPAHFPLIYDKEIKIYENPYALSRAFIVYRIEPVAEYKDAWWRLGNADFDISRKITLEEELPEDYQVSNSGESDSGAVIKEYTPNHVVIDAYTEKPGVLVLSDTYYPGWKAYVDGKPVRIYRVNGIVRGVFVEKGKHKIEFKYLPLSFIVGCILSSAAIIILFWMIIVYKKRAVVEGISDEK